MIVKFWGTRGSIPTPELSTVKYGGNTSCVEIRLGDNILILDSGTGIRKLGLNLTHRYQIKGQTFHLLLSHTHWDHIQGFPFFKPAFYEGCSIKIYGPDAGSRNIRDVIAGQMGSEYFPVSLSEMNAKIHFHGIGKNSFSISNFQVDTIYLNHPGITLGFRITCDSGSVVYATDNEPYRHLLLDAKRRLKGASKSPDKIHFTKEEEEFVRILDDEIIQFANRANLLIIDSQYTWDEYWKHLGWGHRPIDNAIEVGIKAGVQWTTLFHHDPDRTDNELDQIVHISNERIERMNLKMNCIAAREGMSLDINNDLIEQLE
jgi:phosphoribosyl 1,2-cyclic phosphodiesterase